MGNNQNNMHSKKQPYQKVLDVSRPKKRTTDTPSAPELVIPKRSIIVPVSEATEPVSEPVKTKQTASDIQPIANRTKAEPESERAPSAPKHSETPAEPETQPVETTADASEQSTDPDKPEDTGAKSLKADPHVRKALEDAKREQELQGYIENREFFVPIGAVARKRSLKVTLMMVFVELLLGLLLINLMLDAGVIRLLEKIPHTNFFGL